MKSSSLNSEDLKVLSFNNSGVGKVITDILEKARGRALKGEYDLSIEDLNISYDEIAIVKNELESKGFLVNFSEEINNNRFIRSVYISWE